MNCLYCGEKLQGRSDKKYCDHHCKSAYQYQERKTKESRFFKIDRQLKRNRSILKAYNKSGKSFVRKEELLKAGFSPNYFTHFWKNQMGTVYLFCYEYGFMETTDNGKKKYVLVTHQDYMDKK